MNTYGMVTAMSNCGNALGSAIGPIMGGKIIDALDYSWLSTVLAFLTFTMVRVINCVQTLEFVCMLLVNFINAAISFPFI